VQKIQKINIDKILFKTIILFCKYLALIIRIDKLILKILIDKNIFFNFALFFVLQNLRLLKYYAKKLKTIKTNLIKY